MSTSLILMNLVMSALVLAGLAATVLTSPGLWPDSGNGRAFGRGPFRTGR